MIVQLRAKKGENIAGVGFYNLGSFERIRTMNRMHLQGYIKSH